MINDSTLIYILFFIICLKRLIGIFHLLYKTDKKLYENMKEINN
jgi:hypothetical protein